MIQRLARLRAHKRSLLSWLFIALSLFALDAFGQRSGGRMGSSSFGRSSSSSSFSSPSSSRSSSWGSSRSSGWGSSRSSGWGSSRSSSRSGYRSSGSSGSSTVNQSSAYGERRSNDLIEFLRFLYALGPRGLGAILVIVLIVYALTTYGPWSKSSAPTAPRADFEVRRVSVGLDSSVRALVQAALDETASEIDPASDRGRYRMLERVRDILREHLAGVRYAGWVSKKVTEAGAEELFTATTVALHQRFDQLTNSNVERFAPPEVRARAEEGGGFVVVSIVTATDTHLADLPMWPTREAVDGALITCVPRFPQQLIALEIVWSPSVDQDRLSSAELEMLYPELVLVDGAAPGRVQCKYCRCVSAQELGECPACGSKERVAPPPNIASMPPSTGALAASVSSAQTIPCPQCRQPTRFYETQCEHCGARLHA